MKITEQNPPRVFRTGRAQPIDLRDCARIQLAADEQVTFVTESGAEYDVARKDWGFYATPSLNGRLASFGLRAVLVRNPGGRYFVLLVEKAKQADFDAYVNSERLAIMCWMDSDESLRALERK